jgi:hypothetical protein
MKNILPIILILSITFSYGQIDPEKFDELVLVDYQNYNFNGFYGRTYLIKLKEVPLKLYDLKLFTGHELYEQAYGEVKAIRMDTLKDYKQVIENFKKEIERLKAGYTPSPEIVRELEVSEIEKLINEVNNISGHDQILTTLGLTIDSLKKQSDTFLIRYLTEHKIKYNEKKLTFCKDKLEDFELYKKTSIMINGWVSTSDYPKVSIELRNEKDTISYYTEAQNPYMLPWRDKNGKAISYNPNLSIALGQLLPGYEHSNQDRLLGKRGLFGDYLTTLYFFTIKDNCINSRKKLITH